MWAASSASYEPCQRTGGDWVFADFPAGLRTISYAEDSFSFGSVPSPKSTVTVPSSATFRFVSVSSFGPEESPTCPLHSISRTQACTRSPKSFFGTPEKVM